ncbi:GNAT family N-acetyltransferase [Flaviflagellibacter deserti]|jgi:putative acetyltransferase|uniref:GNAT family N-acetyltransferase n=1 Tax=Flaviflagellibacter deserti TaxID=2267266 RepID=A0ABV9YX11_9HYPH
MSTNLDFHTEVVLREARDEDGRGIRDLIAGVFAEYPDLVFLDEEFPELARAATNYRNMGGRLWVLEDGREIIGSIAIVRSGEPGIDELFKFYLHKSRRGSGLADVLFGKALDFARSRGSKGIVLWTDTRFVSGHRFYEKNGFIRGREERELGDASNSREYVYRRDL